MKAILLFIIVSSSFIPSLLPGLKAKELIESEQVIPSKTLFEDLLQELNGAHLRIAATHLPPTMTIEKNSDGTFRYSGFASDACHYLSQVFKFTYSFVNTVEEEVKQSGAIEAQGNLLKRNEADIATTDIQLFLRIYSQFDISIPFYSAGSAFMVPWPDEESRLLAPIYPFQPMVWIILLIVMVAMAFIFTCLPGIHRKLITIINNPENRENLQQPQNSYLKVLSDQALAIMANVTGHAGSWSVRKQLFYRILLGSWCLAVVVLVNAYSSLLISYLTIPTLKPIAKSFDDITFRNVQGLKPIVEKNNIANNMITVSNQSIAITKIQQRAVLFAKYFKEHPERIFTTSQQRFDLLYAGDAAYGYNEFLSLTLLNELNKKAGYCKITLSTKRLSDLTQFHRVFLFKKHWRYTDAMRNKMQWWSDTGLAMHWINSYLPSSKQCLFEDYKKNSPAVRVFTLKDLSSAFVVLLMGCALSLLVFIVEKINYYRTMRLSS